ncbi:hypothetical protein [Echinicola rosea]|uniref:hypothetical protein n=1 Tax=Echinicola rosea TaxID=1807691 RepID=UPI0010CA724E|nr:hypothetical protein [Echinicola rosea]
MGSIFFPWAVIFLAKSLGGFHPFTFVTFLLQVKKVTQTCPPVVENPPLRHGAQLCSYWPKIKTYPHAGKLLLSKAKQAYLKPGKPSLAANILFGQHFVKQACLFACPLFNFLTPNTCKADPINNLSST